MKMLALSLGAIGSLGVVALGGRTIAADRMAHTRPAAIVDSTVAAPAASTDTRVWYGGTLSPIVVVAEGPARARARAARDCPVGGT